MPNYVYKCKECEGHFEVFHGMSESQSDCVLCSHKDVYRVPQMPFLKPSEASVGTKVGEKTKAAIEANRALLEQSKKEAAKDYYRDDD